MTVFLISFTSLPVIVKGILHPEDARLAMDAGVAAIWVSNHGARQVDGVPPTVTSTLAPQQLLNHGDRQSGRSPSYSTLTNIGSADQSSKFGDTWLYTNMH